MTPSEVAAAAVGQHSQTRRSTASSDSCVQRRSKTAARRLMSPTPSSPGVAGGLIARPSSQIRPSPRAAHVEERGEAVLVLRAVVVRRKRRRPGAPVVGSIAPAGRRRHPTPDPRRSSSASARRASGRASRTTDGTSAKLAKKSSPETIGSGSDQPVAVRCENLQRRRATRRSPASSERRPCSELVSCGCALARPGRRRQRLDVGAPSPAGGGGLARVQCVRARGEHGAQAVARRSIFMVMRSDVIMNRAPPAGRFSTRTRAADAVRPGA